VGAAANARNDHLGLRDKISEAHPVEAGTLVVHDLDDFRTMPMEARDHFVFRDAMSFHRGLRPGISIMREGVEFFWSRLCPANFRHWRA
jgi:hypothetical protein